MNQERLHHLVGLLVQPGYSLRRDGEDWRICGPSESINSTEFRELDDLGFLKGFPNGGGAWGSEKARVAYIRANDEMGDGTIPYHEAES